MKNTLALIILTITFTSLYAQTPRFAKYDIGSTGCQIYMPAPTVFEISYSEDSSEVWSGEAESGGHSYGVICVKFAENTEATQGELTELLKLYLDFLQTQLSVVSAAGYGEGHQLAQYPDVYGILDYWQDTDSVNYTVMGWINNEYLAVLMVYGAEEPEYTISNTFLQGMRFPE